VTAARPDLFLYLGDAIYADFDGENTYDVSAETLEREWGVLAARSEFQRLAETVPVMAAWDNHDYGRHARRGLAEAWASTRPTPTRP
jgi:alkaline phosphatase D